MLEQLEMRAKSLLGVELTSPGKDQRDRTILGKITGVHNLGEGVWVVAVDHFTFKTTQLYKIQITAELTTLKI